MSSDRYVDLLKQGFMKPRRVKRTYSVGVQSSGLLNTKIASKAEALKVARHYTKLEPTPTGGYAYMAGVTYIWVEDNEGNKVAAWSKQVHKWARVS